MKIAFDEHIPLAIVSVFKTLGSEGFLRGHEFVSARDYHASGDVPNDDRPWLQRFKDDGGKIVITGDRKMRGKLHERRALKTAGFTVFFFGRAWDEMDKYGRAAVLLRWWPIIEKNLIDLAQPKFWELPCTWRLGAMEEVTGPD